MSQGFSQRRRKGEPHRVAVIVDENSNPFEVGCACEIFGQRRPEVGGDLYRFLVCSPRRHTPMRDNLFALSASGTLHDVDRADNVIVPNRPDVETAHRSPPLADAIVTPSAAP